MGASIAGSVSGVLSGLVASQLSDWQGTIFGHTMTFHAILSFITGGIRILALLWLIGITEPGAVPTGEALKQVGAELLNTSQQVVPALVHYLERFTDWLGRP